MDIKADNTAIAAWHGEEHEHCIVPPGEAVVGTQIRIKTTEKSCLFTVVADTSTDDEVIFVNEDGLARLGANTGDIEHTIIVPGEFYESVPLFGGTVRRLGVPHYKDRCVLIIAPHGGKIEYNTDIQAKEMYKAIRAKGISSSYWLCKGFAPESEGDAEPSIRWHITSTDINPASFPKLEEVANRKYHRR